MLLHGAIAEDRACEHSIELDSAVAQTAPEPEQPSQTLQLVLIAEQIQAELPFLRRAVQRWHREAADADDLVQDTVLRALASLHRWQPGTNLRAWLTTIMRNQFFDTLARNRLSDRVEEVIEIIQPATTEDVEARLTLRDVNRAVERLPEKQRAAVLLAGIEGKSYSEVASLMGLSVEAVRCHLARARDRLRHAVFRPDETNWIRAGTPRTRSMAKCAVR